MRRIKLNIDTTALVKPSALFLIFCICFSVLLMDAWRAWHFDHHNFVWDIANYYSYLPATFCNEGSFEFGNGVEGYLPALPDGKHIPKVTYGMSILYSPFFALGYKVAINEREVLNGFSQPFATCIHWGSIFYVLLGLFFLRKFLLKYYNEVTTTVTLIISFFGTMLFYYTYADGEMTHGYLFMLISAFLLVTYNWHLKVSLVKTLLIGFLIGLLSLIRPTEILVSLLFIFWNVSGLQDLKERFRKFWEFKWHLLLMIIVVILLWLPQFFFWKKMTGNYFFFSYGNERFFWDDPQIVNVLFSYRKGWVTYTPLILLAFIGFFFMKDEVKKLRPAFLGLLIINIYVLSCWWDWFFGGCFGARGFCQHIAFLALPIAACCNYFLKKENFTKSWLQLLKLVFFVFVFSGICLNMGQTNQYIKHYIHFNSMTKECYWHVFGKYYLDEHNTGLFWSKLKEPDYEKLRSGENRDQ